VSDIVWHLPVRLLHCRLSTVQNADCICVIDQNQIVEQGTHTELMGAEAKGVYKALVKRQLQQASEFVGTNQ
jgi:ABC-type multidrug transport system fused ATPase/permease subunit